MPDSTRPRAAADGVHPATALHLSPKHRAVIEALLRKHLPDVEVWAYGSRVNGQSHDGSDLDLVLRGPGLKRIPTGALGDFEVPWDDSLPGRGGAPGVDRPRPSWSRCAAESRLGRDVRWLPEEFHREIERTHVVLMPGKVTT